MRLHQPPVTRQFVVISPSNLGACSKRAIAAAAACSLGAAGLTLTLELLASRPAMALPFARNCAALEAYVNQVGRSMTPPVQVSELSDWYETDNYVACESGRVVRYLQSSTEVCKLYGENRWPYTAVDYVPSRKRLKVRTSTCTVLPPQPLPWVAEQPTPSASEGSVLERFTNALNPGQLAAAAAPLLNPTALGAVLLVSGVAGMAWLRLRPRPLASGTPSKGDQPLEEPGPMLLQEDVAFLLDPPEESSPQAAAAATAAAGPQP